MVGGDLVASFMVSYRLQEKRGDEKRTSKIRRKGINISKIDTKGSLWERRRIYLGEVVEKSARRGQQPESFAIAGNYWKSLQSYAVFRTGIGQQSIW